MMIGFGIGRYYTSASQGLHLRYRTEIADAMVRRLQMTLVVAGFHGK